MQGGIYKYETRTEPNDLDNLSMTWTEDVLVMRIEVLNEQS